MAMESSSIKISNRLIGKDYVPLVIPEIGINHNGDLDVAKKMVDAAYDAGAEIIKHQTHIAEAEMSIIADSVIPVHTDKSIYRIMKECALSEKEEIELKDYVEDKKMIYLSTPFSRPAADRLEKMGVHAYKIGSGEMNNIPLVKHIASFKKPMIVSTGMNDIESIRRTVNVLKEHNVEFALLHTTNLYPTPTRFVRLGAMLEMKEAFPEVVYGLSDHTTNNNACVAAIALGASIIERHFTDHRERTGPDIACSMDKDELKALLQSSIEVHEMLGGEKKPLDEEQSTIDFAFATVVAASDIKKGEVFTRENIWVKRPGCGEIPASDYEKLVGAKASVTIISDSHIKWDMVINCEQ